MTFARTSAFLSYHSLGFGEKGIVETASFFLSSCWAVVYFDDLAQLLPCSRSFFAPTFFTQMVCILLHFIIYSGRIYIHENGILWLKMVQRLITWICAALSRFVCFTHFIHILSLSSTVYRLAWTCSASCRNKWIQCKFVLQILVVNA